MMKGWGRLKLAALAVVVTLAIVFVGNASTDIVLGQWPFQHGSFGSIDAWDVAVLHVAFTGVPMFALALMRDDRPVMWAVAIGLSACSWAYFVWQIWRDSMTGFAGGANIGLGLTMLVAPFAIVLVLMALGFILRVAATSKS